MAELSKRKRIEMNRHFRNISDSCCAERRKAPKSMNTLVCPVVESVGGAYGLWSPEAQSIAKSQIDELNEHSAIARAAVMFLTTKAASLEEVCNEVHCEHDDIVKMI